MVAEILRSTDPARALAELEALVDERSIAREIRSKRHPSTAAAMDALDTARDIKRLVLQIKAELRRHTTAAESAARRSAMAVASESPIAT